MSGSLQPANGMPLYDSRALRRIEAQADVFGGDEVLMRRAGLAAWHASLTHWPRARRILVVCGPGNNGGDGWVLARHAREAGRAVRVLQLPSHASRGELAQRMRQEFLEAGGHADAALDDVPRAGSEQFDLIVDALFGIGFSRVPDAGTAALIETINAMRVPVLALDVPSGVDADTGRVPGVAVHASHTVQFIGAHLGLATGAALDHVGVRSVASLDVPRTMLDELPVAAHQIAADALPGYLPRRRRNTHKGESGRVLCIGGDHGKGGAIAMCAEAALRAGAGLVDVATRAEHVIALLSRRPEAMARAVDAAASLQPLIESADVIALGPGLGQGEWGHALQEVALAAGKSLVLDADALNLLASTPRVLPSDTILTPHPGEAARLLGTSTQEVQASRYAAANSLCERYGCVIVLKGAGTVIAAPGETMRVIAAGNPGMAVGGMGDILTGIIASLRAQGLSAFDAACCGALLHAAAGDAAAQEGGERGLLPSDLFAHVRRLANS
ncbi:NAD(P)H-hydrate dehydratase [Luteimonas panaciterrae]|uniref:NAD(P)H-hydrate dehydratase n=1 Tax=Luteimonas panaciterrae TaxID=363885 RepID=UPI001CFB5E96|nr:NAD(P)H-hydrate dehydratase [Luteimonas panaciterrae]